MFRYFRYRCMILRYIIFWICMLFLIKLSILFYYELQHQAVDTSSLALPYDNSKPNKDQIRESLDVARNTARSTNPAITLNRTAIQYYRQYVNRKNVEQFMYNNELFSLTTTRYILLVQVHTRVVYLKKFIEMLKSVESINQTLLIFSHDFIDPEINKLVTNISFVPVIQIFYPFSQQLYPDEFPGLDPNDCPRDIAKHRALATKCNNAPYPDKYGHYREVSIVQIKHHWWWKLNFVFNSVDVLRNRSDILVLLLEEDFYLSPDALYFLQKMENEKSKLCPECIIYTLGNLEKAGRQFNNLGAKVSIAYWHARYNLGMTISHEIWHSLVQYAEEFCNVDDYNWDWSLVYLAQKRFNFPRVIWSSAARVIHLGSCGTHHKKTCSNQSDIARWEETEKFYQNIREYLFPTVPLKIHAKYEIRRPLKQTNGGWSDLRDRQLCLSFALKNTQDISHIKINL